MRGRLSIAALAERVKALGGWHCRAAAVIAGAASVLALAPFFAWPILWCTLPALVWLTDGAIARGTHSGGGRRWYRRPTAAAAEIGWWFGFGYFLAGLFWIGEAFLVDADSFAFLMPFAVLLMPAGLALFHGAAVALAAQFWRTGIYRVVALALALSAMEWLRGHILSGFPWNVLGYALTHPVSLMQSVAVFGIYGLTLIAVLISYSRSLRYYGARPQAAGPGARRLPSPCCPWSSPAWQAISGLHVPLRPWCPE
jgi:apolipoprotein N-acyltransferase